MAGVDWKALAEEQLAKYFSREAEKSDADLLLKFADMYSGREVETLSEGFKCANCFKQATHRCSRCKVVWYCCRECQAEHYKKEHKGACKILADRSQAKNSKHPQSSAGKNEILLKPAAPKQEAAEPQPKKKPLIEEVRQTNSQGEEFGGSIETNELGEAAGEPKQTRDALEEAHKNDLEELD